jgi:hypothetical protein
LSLALALSINNKQVFVSKGTEFSLYRFVIKGVDLAWKFVSEHFTPLTLDIQTGVVSVEDTDEIWEFSKKV